MSVHENNVREAGRLALQSALDARKTAQQRNKLGQFATPPSLAEQIVCYGASLLSPDEPIRFLDPAIGTGSFYSALLRLVSPERIADALGYEIDPHYGTEAVRFWQDTPLRLHIGDFTRAEPPFGNVQKPNLLICNPPYVRHQHLSAAEKTRIQRLVERATGQRLSGLAGLYCYFLCLSRPWMVDGGVAGWLIPSEFMDVNYRAQVKRFLLEQVTLLRVHRFAPNAVQFDDALVSSTVLWIRNTPPPEGHVVEWTTGPSLAQPDDCRLISTSALRGEAKWTRLATAPKAAPVPSVRERLKLFDLFKIQRGVATGANGYFILPAEEAEKRGILGECLTPILPAPRYLAADEIRADGNGYPDLARRLFLLSCRLPEEEIRERYPSLWHYLQAGRGAGIHERYLCAHRSPWYAQEERSPAPLVCTYMGRGDSETGRPFRFILNHSRATAANVYLLLYPRPAVQAALRHDPAVLRHLWEGLQRITPGVLQGEGRVYGGGLHKIEPRELGNTPADALLEAVPGLLQGHAEQLCLFERRGVYAPPAAK